jgi:hypothetical protein
MADSVLIGKATVLERCAGRAREEYARGPERFATDFTRQDAAILNIQRACEAALDMGQQSAGTGSARPRAPATCSAALPPPAA